MVVNSRVLLEDPNNIRIRGGFPGAQWMDGRAAVRPAQTVAALWPLPETGEDVGQDTIARNRVGCSIISISASTRFSGQPVNDTTILAGGERRMRRAESMVIIQSCGWF